MPEYSLAELAQILGAELQGDASCLIRGVASLASAQPGDLVFLRPGAKSAHIKMLQTCSASAALLTPDSRAIRPSNALLLANPELAFAKALRLFYPQLQQPVGIHPTAQIGSNCSVDSTASIGPYCVIADGVHIGPNTVLEASVVLGRGCVLGADCYLYSRVTIYHGVKLGNRVILHSGAVIGSDGFGLARDGLCWEKILQVGTVVIGDDVEIGANTTIDRGALDDTCIGDGVKIDNQVQIAHNVKIGAHTAIAACAGIAGSAEIGRYCMIGGGACINGHIQIADGVIVGGGAAISKSLVEPDYYSSVLPSLRSTAWRRNSLRFKELDCMMKRLQQLEKAMEKSSDHVD